MFLKKENLCLFCQRLHAILTDCDVNDLELLHHGETAVIGLRIVLDFGLGVRSLN